MPAAKMGDQVTATDIHIVLIPTPGGPVPTPLPNPFTGIIAGNVSENVMISGQPAATVGSTATNTPPHIPPGGPFQIPPPTKKTDLPAVSIYDAEVSFVEQTLGNNVKEERPETVETFTADGNETSFVLSTRPLKPIIRVENPQGFAKREIEDFTVDYEKGEIRFKTPPEKSGKKSVVVSFLPLKSVSLVSALRVNAKYNLDVWGANREGCNDLATGVVKTILLGREKLASQGIVMRPVSASAIEFENGVSTSASQPFGRRLLCDVETDLYVAVPVPAIEKIEVRKKEFQSQVVI